MKTKLKKLWIQALRGGKYQQGIRFLRNKHNECCCLGVLCDLVEPESWSQQGRNGEFLHGPNGMLMPDDNFLTKVGLNLSTATVLATMNDRGQSFTEIANYIKKTKI